jgi:hypothetical protein
MFQVARRSAGGACRTAPAGAAKAPAKAIRSAAASATQHGKRGPQAHGAPGFVTASRRVDIQDIFLLQEDGL